jgi:hypothetical protein
MSRPVVLRALLPGVICILLTISACSSDTTNAVATRVSETGQAVTEQGVSVVATQVAPRVEALATRVAKSTVPAGAPPIRIADVRFTPSDLAVVIHNEGDEAIELAGYQVRIGGHTLALDHAVALDPGESMTIHTGAGTDTETDVYLGENMATIASAFLADPSVALLDGDGAVIARVSAADAMGG